MLLYIFVLCAFLVVSLSYYRLRGFLRVWQLARQFDGPTPLPLIGNLNLFFNAKHEDVCLIIKDLMDTYGGRVRVWFGSELLLFTSKLRDIEAILGTTLLLDKSFEYSYLHVWLREGLLVSKGSKWFSRRRILTPAFHFKILEQFVEIFDRDSRILVENLGFAAAANQQIVDMAHWIGLATLDIICESAMGVSVNAQTNADSEYVRAVKTISRVLHHRMFDFFYRFDFTYNLTRLAREQRKALAVLHGFTERIIVQRREELLKSQHNKQDQLELTATSQESDDVRTKRRMAFLDILLQAEIEGKPLSNLDIREEVDTFMFEGHDTTSSAITFLCYNLALYPQCQRKCFEEILQVFGGDKHAPITYADLNKLHYIELCIKESLRMYPPVPIVGRKATEECEIDGKILPAGTNINIPPLYLGRMESIYPEANLFKPERFDVVINASKLSPFAYIPFSAGPRNCIGQKFAMLEIKTILTNILRNYEIEYEGRTDEPPVLTADLILRPRDTLMFKIKPRSYENTMQ